MKELELVNNSQVIPHLCLLLYTILFVSMPFFYRFCFISIRLLFLLCFVVLLLEDLLIGMGIVVTRTENVHGHPLREVEQEVQLNHLTAGCVIHIQ